MPKYRKKPVVIEAIEFDGTLDSVSKIDDMIRATGQYGFCRGDGSTTEGREFLNIKTLEGTMRADKGDFIIKGVQDEFYPCKPEIFWKTYEEEKEEVS